MERNRWTSPELDDVAARIRADGPLKIAAARRGHQFLASSQALIHGDLHTGSVMVTESDTRVIDPEFAVYGPIGFDLGAFLANLLMSYYSQPGHASCRRRPPRPAALAARTDPDLLAELCRAVQAALARQGRRRRLSERPVREACRPGRAGRRAGALPRRIVLRHDRLCRRQDHPPHFRLCAQCRFRTDRRSHAHGPKPRSKRCGWRGCSCSSRSASARRAIS